MKSENTISQNTLQNTSGQNQAEGNCCHSKGEILTNLSVRRVKKIF